MLDFRPILLVEDDPKDVELTLAALSAQNLINEIVTVSDGAHALNYLFGTETLNVTRRTGPALILLDLNIPTVDGLTILRAVKSNPFLTAVPVIVLTGSRREEDQFESLRWGVQAYLEKPLSLAVFIDVLSKVGLHLALMEEHPATMR
ncbi:MAG: response regulator [Nitrospiraceae bacterium]